MKLMIGDWVIFMSEQSAGFERVAAIDATGDRVKVTSEYGGGPYDVVDILPIPLTAEILEKNGWRKSPIDYDKEARSELWTCDCDWIIWENHGFMLCRKEDFVGWGIELTYVHELQHALRLCNIDKTIEL